MLKEYIINLMDVNQEEMGRYVEKLKKLQQEYQTGQEWIVNLQKENDLEQNIFRRESQQPEDLKNWHRHRKNNRQ